MTETVHDAPVATPLVPDRLTIAELMGQLLAVSARIDALIATSSDLRAELTERAKATIEAEGVVPTWRVPGLGTIPVSRADPRPVISDPSDFQSWVVTHHPTEATGIVRLPAALLSVLLELIDAMPVVFRDQVSVDTEISPAWMGAWLKGLSVVGEGEDASVVTPDGQLPAGMAVAPGGAVTLSVRLSREAKDRARLELSDPVAEGMLTAPLGEFTAAAAAACPPPAGNEGEGDAEPDYPDDTPALSAGEQLVQAVSFLAADPLAAAHVVAAHASALEELDLPGLRSIAGVLEVAPVRSKKGTRGQILDRVTILTDGRA